MAYAGCDPWELQPGANVTSKYYGKLKGQRGPHQCIVSVRQFQWFVKPSLVYAKCKVRSKPSLPLVNIGSIGGLSGILGFHPSCVAAPGDYDQWFVDGSEWRIYGGNYDTQRGIIKARIKRKTNRGTKYGTLKMWEK